MFRDHGGSFCYDPIRSYSTATMIHQGANGMSKPDQKFSFVPLSVSIDNATKMIGIGRTRMYELINEGTLKTVKLGGRTLIRTKDIEALIDDHLAA